MRYSDESKRTVVSKVLESDEKRLDEIASYNGVHPAMSRSVSFCRF